MRTLLRAGFITLALSVSLLSNAADTPLPPSVRDWQGWVLHGEEFRRCPFVAEGIEVGLRNGNQARPTHSKINM